MQFNTACAFVLFVVIFRRIFVKDKLGGEFKDFGFSVTVFTALKDKIKIGLIAVDPVAFRIYYIVDVGV